MSIGSKISLINKKVMINHFLICNSHRQFKTDIITKEKPKTQAMFDTSLLRFIAAVSCSVPLLSSPERKEEGKVMQICPHLQFSSTT
jgi:hypothetical protein